MMPRVRRIGFIYSPLNESKYNKVYTLNSRYSPLTSRSSSTSTSSKYSPSTYLDRTTVSKDRFDYNPSYSDYSYQYYNPLHSTSLSYILKYAPSNDFEYFYRYAPDNENVLYYDPSLVSKFKPQPIIVSNSDTLNAYFNYVVQLLRVLR